ncbi:MAG: hypothetical protein GF372_04040 [Candidatus Marinimicrobia bacterium]|nr:hypothetical protein [Candidatus Neomarinimicrobiota bacterium]
MAENNLSARGKTRAWIWYGVLLILFIFALFLLWKVSQLQDQVEFFQERQSDLVMKIDSLRTDIKTPEISGEEFNSLISSYDLRQLRRKGLENPIDDLKADLVTRADMIPYEGTLGGTMHFYEEMIYVLTGRWVLAYFEDGHRAGYMLLEYDVNAAGEITWNVLEAYI